MSRDNSERISAYLKRKFSPVCTYEGIIILSWVLGVALSFIFAMVWIYNLYTETDYLTQRYVSVAIALIFLLLARSLVRVIWISLPASLPRPVFKVIEYLSGFVISCFLFLILYVIYLLGWLQIIPSQKSIENHTSIMAAERENNEQKKEITLFAKRVSREFVQCEVGIDCTYHSFSDLSWFKALISDLDERETRCSETGNWCAVIRWKEYKQPGFYADYKGYAKSITFSEMKSGLEFIAKGIGVEHSGAFLKPDILIAINRAIEENESSVRTDEELSLEDDRHLKITDFLRFATLDECELESSEMVPKEPVDERLIKTFQILAFLALFFMGHYIYPHEMDDKKTSGKDE